MRTENGIAFLFVLQYFLPSISLLSLRAFNPRQIQFGARVEFNFTAAAW